MFPKKFSIAFALILTTVISGCASVHYAEICEHFSEPLKIFSGIESVNLSGSSLRLTLLHKGLFSSKLIDNHTPECTERKSSNVESDEKKVKTEKLEWKYIKNSHMIQVSGFDKDYQFWVQNNNEIPKQEVIDLSSAILNTQLSKNTTLKITCLDCNLLGTEEQSRYPNIKMDVVLTHDFRATKLALSEAQKNRDADAEKLQLEQAKRDKEIAKQTQMPKTTAVSNCTNDFDCPTGYSCRTKPVSGSECKLKSPVYDPANTATTQHTEITENPATTTHDEPIISNLEEIKTKCKELGFKPKSDKFGKCVLKLTE
jgi:hypothetical protein